MKIEDINFEDLIRFLPIMNGHYYRYYYRSDLVSCLRRMNISIDTYIINEAAKVLSEFGYETHNGFIDKWLET